jgi:hypothetical protein
VTRAKDGIAVGKLAGAVGVYGNLDPQIEREALGELGLAAETVATQIVARDRHAEVLWALAMVGTAIEQIALGVRHWQRTEVGEAEEGFGAGQKGSSAMPHKKNPILSENLTGLARLLRGYAGAGLEDVALWHERDISHSSVERVSFPDATILVDFMLARATPPGARAGDPPRAHARQPRDLGRAVLLRGGAPGPGGGRPAAPGGLRLRPALRPRRAARGRRDRRRSAARSVPRAPRRRRRRRPVPRRRRP